MPDRQFDEKEEKEEKQEEKEEKSWDEKWRRDPLGSVVWAGILIWVGLVLLGDNLNLLPETLNTWSLIFFGAGGIILLEALIRVLVPAYRRPVLGTIILGVVFLGIGASGLFETWNWGVMWAIILVGLGVVLLLRGFRGGPRV